MYAADPSYTYQVGGYSGDAWTYTYTRTLNSIFGDDAVFDTSILISGNIDCDLFKSINNTRYEWMMFADDSAPSNPNFRKMMVDPQFGEYEQAKLLGACLLASSNWSSFSVYNLTKKQAVIGADMGGARFCLGNKTSGFQKLILYPTSMSVEKKPPDKATSTGTRYSSINYSEITTLENIQDRTLKSAGFEIKHTERGLENVMHYTFNSDYRPILTFVIQYDDDILLVNAAYLLNKGDGGLVNSYKRGIPVSHAFGKILNEPKWVNMNTVDTTPQWVASPNLGDRPDNDMGMYCEVYTSRSYWYIYTHMLYNGSIVRRLLTISGLFFLWDSALAQGGISTVTFNEGLCLGTRDEYGQIKQDSYNKGWTSIVQNDEYYDKLDYNKLPVVNPEPPSGGDDDDIDKLSPTRIINNATCAGVTYYLFSEGQMKSFTQICANPDYWTREEFQGFDPLAHIISIKQYFMTKDDLEKYALFSTDQVNVLMNGHAFWTDTEGTHTFKAYEVIGQRGMQTIGTYTLTKARHDFLNYSPYSAYEVYVPGCGWIDLPDSIVKSDGYTVELATDVINGTCVAYIRSGNLVVANATGVLGVNTILSAESGAIKDASIAQAKFARNKAVAGALSSLVGLGATTAAGIATGGPAGGAVAAATNYASTFGSVQDIFSSNLAVKTTANANYTTTIGSNNDISTFMLPRLCIAKTIRDKIKEPSNFGKLKGYVCYKSGKVGDFSGFTIFTSSEINIPDATNQEKELINNLLMSGVRVNYS